MSGESKRQGVWPDGARGAVSFTFDDGSESQFRRAFPILTERGLRGTFYMVPWGDDYARRLAPWQAVHEAGHEIGNHSLSHTCTRNYREERDARGLETMTLAEMEADLVEAERRLQGLFPREERSFCYPCYFTYVGAGAGRQSYVPLVARHFIAGRAGGEYGLFNHPYNSDLACLAGNDCQRMPGTELVGLAERAARQGRWAIFVFHGIDTGRLGIAEPDLIELADHLAAHRDRIWTAPVAEVARHLTAVRR
jgi:peptidoglycan/xylan/chitin deacetylase (PgdA/CDA1 family)